MCREPGTTTIFYANVRRWSVSRDMLQPVRLRSSHVPQAPSDANFEVALRSLYVTVANATGVALHEV